MVDALAQFLDRKWLLEKVFTRFKRQTSLKGGGVIAAHEDVFEVGPNFQKAEDELIAKESWHDDVAQDQVDLLLLFFVNSHGLVARGSWNDFVTRGLQALPQEFAD